MKRIGLLLALGLLVFFGVILVGSGLRGGAQAQAQTVPALPTPVFGANVRANSDSTTFGQHEPSLAVSRVHTNTVVIAAKDYRESNVKHVWIDTSTDGGVTWPVGRQLQIPGIPPQLNIQSDAVVMARDDGRIYVAALATNDGQSLGGIFITWTDDDGATWRNPSVPVFFPENTLDDKEWFAIDNNPASPYYHRMYMMYAPGAGFVVAQYSTDGGVTWSTRQNIGQSNTEYTYPVVGSDGTIYNFMMLNWGANRTGTIQLTKSTNGGVNWSPAATVTTADQPASPIRPGDSFRFFAILSAAVDPNNGALYVAWTDRRNFAASGTDVVYVKSTDGGTSWGAVTRLSHDPMVPGLDHLTPMITVSADSTLHAFWLDRRLANGPTNNRYFDSWYSSSTDGGATWDPDTRVSTVSQDLNAAFPPGSGNAAGDYWGLDTWLDTVYVAWNDTRSGDQDILVTKGLLPRSAGSTPTPTPPPGTPTATFTPGPTNTPTLTATGTPPTATPTITATAPPATATPTATATATAPPSNTATSSATRTTTPTQTVLPGCDPAWRQVASPNVGILRGVAAAGVDDVWAVGDGNLHWNGSAWASVPFATPPVLPSATPPPMQFYGVAAAAPNSAWAVGAVIDSHAFQIPLAEHWDGTAWTVISIAPSRDDPASTLYYLTAASALNANEAYMTSLSTIGTMSLGKLWRCTATACQSLAELSGLGFGGFYSVAAIAANDVWVVGAFSDTGPFAAHWDGSTLTQYPLAAAAGVAAVTSNDVWVVGSDALSQSLIYHWNGTGWQPVPSPNIGGLSAVAARAANDVWAVGVNGGALHWNGTVWTQVSTPAANLGSLAITAPNNVWAVGNDAQNASVILHYADQPLFEDVPPSNTFYSYIQWMACRGYISGYPCGGLGEPCQPPGNRPYFRPGNSVTRGQLLKMVVNAAAWPLVTPTTATFEDVPPGDTFYSYIETGVSHGVINGYPCGSNAFEPCVAPGNRPYFRPNTAITRGQISKVTALARSYPLPTPTAGTFEDVPPGSTFFSYVEAVVVQGIVVGYPCGANPNEPCVAPGNRPYFRPGANATRGQVAKIVTIAYGGP